MLDFLADHLRWHRVDESLWTYSVDLKLLGANVGRRMAAVRRGDGAFTLIGPVPLNDFAKAELGTVDSIVLASAFHNRYVTGAAELFPDAVVYATEAAKTERIDADRLRKLPGDLPHSWKADLVACRLEGMPRVNEVVFLHRASRSLIVADLCFNLDRRYSLWTKLFFSTTGSYGGPKTSKLFKAMVKDRQAFAASLDRVLDWDFDRIVVAHGDILDVGGKQVIRTLREWAG